MGSTGSRRSIEAEAVRNRYVLVTEPKRNGGKIVTQRKGTGRFRIQTHGRPAHSGGSHEKGRSAIRAMAKIILEIEAFTDYSRGITTNVGLINGGTAVNVIPEFCTIEADVRVSDMAAAAEMEQRFAALKSGDPDAETVAQPATIGAAPAGRLSGPAEIASRLGLKLEMTAVRRRPGRQSTAAKGIATIDGLGVDGDGAIPTTSTCSTPRSSLARD